VEDAEPRKGSQLSSTGGSVQLGGELGSDCPYSLVRVAAMAMANRPSAAETGGSTI
jgi:hypothetical protein